jgi:hypothetical protein
VYFIRLGNDISLIKSAANGKPYPSDRFSSLYLKIELDTIKEWLKRCCCPGKVPKINKKLTRN